MEITKQIRLLVGLDLSEMDEVLLCYIQVARELYTIESVTFLHNVKLSELPDELKTTAALQKIEIGIKQRLHQLIQNKTKLAIPYTVEVTLETYSETAFLQVSKRIGANLVVLGNKQDLLGGGGLTQKLVRVLPHSSLLVPETFRLETVRIIEAIDFSRYTPVIQTVGRQIQSQSSLKNLQVAPVHVSKLSWQFFPGSSPNERKRMQAQDVMAKQQKWRRLYPDREPLTVIQSNERSIAVSLADYIKEQNIDLVIMGVMGVSSLTGLFLGSVANELMTTETQTCILLVKKRP